ncbi:cupin domain-containing protein [Oribacterium sp. oral taxon 102]|uniref:cupin domain-containing protein n=1 Tax=Oribacterium sp. oral taxon 102 TaxID=671214 RepID=UPI0015B7B780|nr:cupin domain-containing protein [Oribacterium sp. oral taxon 102]NWO22018.1 cupin domain-containing protein [Oribacterium sp. oral taxon 102]
MVRLHSELDVITKESPFNGVGRITVKEILSGSEEMYGKGRVFAHTKVYPGSRIGLHRHVGDAEVYYILSGSGRYNDNGKIIEVHPGDVCYCRDGEAHSIEAMEEPVEMIALILYH